MSSHSAYLVARTGRSHPWTRRARFASLILPTPHLDARAASTSSAPAASSSTRKPRGTGTKRAGKVGSRAGNATDASSAKASSVDLSGMEDARDVKPQHFSRGASFGDEYAADAAGGAQPNTLDPNAPGYLAPDYTLNPAGPASSADIDFKCPHCDKTYRGKHARSIWRRHLQDKHGIPLAAQPRRTRWDNGEWSRCAHICRLCHEPDHAG